jgi:hypothetical protein
MAVAMSAQIAMVATVVTCEVAHAVLAEAILPNHKAVGHVVVVPVATIGHVVLLTEVDRPLVVPAVGWVVAHRLPSMSVPPAATNGGRCIVLTVVTLVPHLLEGVDASRHTIPGSKPHVVESANMPGNTVVEGIPVPTTNHPCAHVVPVLNGSPPLMAVVNSAQVEMVDTVTASVEAHAMATELVLVNEKTVGHVGVAPVVTVGHVVLLTEVDGLPVVPAVGWVVAHWLPSTTVLRTALDGSGRVVTTVRSSVLHLAERVTTSWHTIPGSEPDVVESANNPG